MNLYLLCLVLSLSLCVFPFSLFHCCPLGPRQVFVRAMADYAPVLDPTIPCPDAGMALRKGELLEIVDQTDSLWWQAKKLQSSTTCAGLIPSTNSLKKWVLI